MIEIAVCDNEEIIREQIKNLIEKQDIDCHIESYATGDELLARGKKFDLVFLDIKMRGMDGLETAKAFRALNENAVLIVITADKEYVFKAFDVAAFHYLLKPIEERKFTEVLGNAVREVQKRSMKELRPLFVKTKNRSFALDQKEIVYIESRAKKVAIHRAGDVIEMYGAMNKLEEQLGSSFYRCHRGYLVNMAHIAEYSSDMIDMSNGERIYLAKEKYREFEKEYLRYLQVGEG